MRNLERVLAAIDFSIYCPQVLRFAADLAQELRTELAADSVLHQRDVQAIE
ncbi:MAG: hypothetical protein ACM3KE_10755 [Hyphomicrobiales bacterium]